LSEKRTPQVVVFREVVKSGERLEGAGVRKAGALRPDMINDKDSTESTAPSIINDGSAL
jgi:hypothetical protein